MIRASPTFNAASYFIDRHVVEGRASSVAIECGDRRITYGELHEEVNRIGTALRDELDVRPEERVLLAEYKRPRWIEFVDALPTTATGKIQRFKLRERDAGA